MLVCCDCRKKMKDSDETHPNVDGSATVQCGECFLKAYFDRHGEKPRSSRKRTLGPKAQAALEALERNNTLPGRVSICREEYLAYRRIMNATRSFLADDADEHVPAESEIALEEALKHFDEVGK